MHKSVAAIVIITFILISLSVVVCQPSVGVKKGDWIEYTVSTTGTPPPEQDLTWARIEILQVEGTVFQANFTVRYVNGSVSSGVRTFDFSVGQVQAWIIIPANLGVGDVFYDLSINSNVTIQGELHKNVAGANRVITSTNTTERHKEWDKATGVYVQSVDNLGNYTINAQATATNMWAPQIIGLDPTMFYSVIVTTIVAVVIIVAIVILARKKKRIKPKK